RTVQPPVRGMGHCLFYRRALREPADYFCPPCALFNPPHCADRQHGDYGTLFLFGTALRDRAQNAAPYISTGVLCACPFLARLPLSVARAREPRAGNLGRRWSRDR